MTSKVGIAGNLNPTLRERVPAAVLGVAGLDENRRLQQLADTSVLGVVTEGRGNQLRGMCAGFAGLDRPEKVQAIQHAVWGVAGVKQRSIWQASHRAACGIAGLNDRSIWQTADHAIGPGYPEHQVVERRARIGDQVAARGHEYALLFADYTYVVKSNGRGVTWRKGRERVFGPAHRALPVGLDSAAFRRFRGSTPRWADFESYLAAIELVQPDLWAAYDVIGDQKATNENMEKMAALGYAVDGRFWPVWQVREKWDPRAGARLSGPAYRRIPEKARTAIANARIAARDADLRRMVERWGRVMLGGMVKGPIPRDVRGYYIWELTNQFPDCHFWGLGQASFKVVNQLGSLGILHRVSLDGSWWILDAACERFAVLQDGVIVMHSLEGIARSFFTIVELMAANLRSLLAAYMNAHGARLWDWPPPPPLPLDQHDPEQAQELHRRFVQAAFELGLRRRCGLAEILEDYDV